MKQTLSIASIMAILAALVTLIISYTSGSLIDWALSIPSDTGWTITLIVGIITSSVITALVLSIIWLKKES